MASLTNLQFMDEPEFRIALAQNGVTGAAADRLVADEAANRRVTDTQERRSRSIWNTVQSFVLSELAGSSPQAALLPSPDVVAALSRLIIATEFYTGGDLHHPAFAQLDASGPPHGPGSWADAVATAPRNDGLVQMIRVEPHESGLSLQVSHQPKLANQPALITTDVPAIGSTILPRHWLCGLAVEALHRLSNTQRRFDRPAFKLSGLSLHGTGAAWSRLLDPLLDPPDRFGGGQQPHSAATSTLIIIPPSE